MKTAVKITIELLLLVGAIYIKYIDKNLSVEIEENQVLDSVVFFISHLIAVTGCALSSRAR